METNVNTNIGANLETTHTVDLSDKLYKVMLGVIAIAVIFLVAQIMYQFKSLPQNLPHEIVISGEGRAFAKPDIAQVSFGVTTESLKSQDAVNKNNEIMNNVIKAIKDMGVQDKDIQTTFYNLSPIYDYPSILYPAGTDGSGVVSSPVYVNKGREFKGYSLNQQVSIKIRDFDKISDILDKATSNGATNVSDLQFRIDDPEKIQSEAREMAIAKAKEKLEDILKQSGLKVGKLVNISEGYSNYPQPMFAQGGALMKDVESVVPQIQAGQQEVSSTVTLTYQVK